jgi:hypothetical protein
MRSLSIIAVLIAAILVGISLKSDGYRLTQQYQKQLYDAYADLLIAGDENAAPLLGDKVRKLSPSATAQLDNFALVYTKFEIETEEDKTTDLLSKGVNYSTPTQWSEPTQIDYDVLLTKYKWVHVKSLRKKVDSAMGVMAHYFTDKMPDKSLADLLHNMIYNTKMGMYRNYYLVFDKQFPLP